MFKRIGLFALLLSSIGAAVMPNVAFAQDGYYAPRDNYYYQSDRSWDRHEAREWRERERAERRAEARREREERREWREQQWRRSHDYDRGYYRDNYPGPGYPR